ncbi:MAG: DUF3761 domain-containing protein [Pseudomonadota bacterium]|nr:DUF3761 domain-containing protein [Pseudomonadota bacterium]
MAGLALAFACFAVPSSFAQSPAAMPAGSTGLCKDGSYTAHATKKGACGGHKGVKEWFAAAGDAKTESPAATAAAPMATNAAISKPAAATPAPAAKRTAATTAAMAPAAGGGPGQVWANSSTKVYHCAGSRYYGKTKQGSYMTEAAAKAGGMHADHGKACS